MNVENLNKEGLHRVVVVKELPYQCEGFLVIRSIKNGICTGGLRISPEVCLDEIICLAISMDLKFMAQGFELGGAKAGLNIPKSLNRNQRCEVLSSFAKAIEPYLVDSYLTGPDLGSTNEDVSVMYNAISMNQMVLSKKLLQKTPMKSLLFHVPDFILRCFPTGYSKYGEYLTGLGLIKSLETLNSDLHNREIIIHGAGSVTRGMLQSLKGSGVKVKAIADINHGVVFEKTKTPSEVLSILENGYIQIDTKMNKVCPRSILFLKADVLILASHSQVIKEEDIDKIQVKVILEGANNTMSPRCDRLLFANDILVIPDFLANSAISCSFAMMVFNKVNPLFEKKLIDRTVNHMSETLRKLSVDALNSNVNLRDTLLSQLSPAVVNYLENLENY